MKQETYAWMLLLVLMGLTGELTDPASPLNKMISEVCTVVPVLQVILTVRNPETWYASVQDVIVRLHRWVLRPFFWTTQLGRQYTAIIGWGLDYMFKGDLSKENCVRAFNMHTEEVKSRIPEERLLIWRPQDGWEPLAKCASQAPLCK